MSPAPMAASSVPICLTSANAESEPVKPKPCGLKTPPSLSIAATFAATVSYPATKGSFTENGSTDCEADDGTVTAQDNGSGTLSLALSGDFATDQVDAVDVLCTFHELGGQDLEDGEVTGTSGSGIAIDVSF